MPVFCFQRSGCIGAKPSVHLRNFSPRRFPCASLLCALLVCCAPLLTAPAQAGPFDGALYAARQVTESPQRDTRAAAAQEAPAAGQETQGREKSRQDLSDGSLPERLFKGSLLGAVFFGYPYEGIRILDIAGLSILALFLLRLFLRGKNLGKNAGNGTPPAEHHRTIGEPRTPGTSTTTSPGPGEPASGQPEEQGWKWGQERQKDGTQKNGSAMQDHEKDAPPRDDGPWRKDPESPPDKDSAAAPRPATVKEQAAALWAYYGQNAEQRGPATTHGAAQGFDEADFLEGARTLYVRLQNAWAARRVEELQPFVSESMFQLLQNQAAKDPHPAQVEILFVDAELTDMRHIDHKEQATVVFKVLLRSGQEEPQTIQELWRFARGPESNGMWRLEGIEAHA